jgi:hypothetical protein
MPPSRPVDTPPARQVQNPAPAQDTTASVQTAASEQQSASDAALARVVAPPIPVVPPPEPARTVTLQAGTTVQVRIDQALSADKNSEGDTFTATLEGPLVAEGFAIAERGARVEGRVVKSDRGGKVQGLSTIALELTGIRTSDGQRVAIQTEPYEQKAEGTVKQDAAKVGAAAGIGAAIGAIAGGGKGAAIGAAIGGASGTGGVLLTRGKPAQITSETRLNFRLRDAVSVTEKR